MRTNRLLVDRTLKGSTYSIDVGAEGEGAVQFGVDGEEVGDDAWRISIPIGAKAVSEYYIFDDRPHTVVDAKA